MKQVRMVKETAMVVKIIRSDFIHFKVFTDSVLNYELVSDDNFWNDNISLFTPENKLIATYNRNGFFFMNRRSLHLFEFDQIVPILRPWSIDRVWLNNDCYELRYGFLNFKGFFFNNEKVATLKTNSAGLGFYDRDITVLKEVNHFYLFILLYVAMNNFDVN